MLIVVVLVWLLFDNGVIARARAVSDDLLLDSQLWHLTRALSNHFLNDLCFCALVQLWRRDNFGLCTLGCLLALAHHLAPRPPRSHLVLPDCFFHTSFWAHFILFAH